MAANSLLWDCPKYTIMYALYRFLIPYARFDMSFVIIEYSYTPNAFVLLRAHRANRLGIAVH